MAGLTLDPHERKALERLIDKLSAQMDELRHEPLSLMERASRSRLLSEKMAAALRALADGEIRHSPK